MQGASLEQDRRVSEKVLQGETRGPIWCNTRSDPSGPVR